MKQCLCYPLQTAISGCRKQKSLPLFAINAERSKKKGNYDLYFSKMTYWQVWLIVSRAFAMSSQHLTSARMPATSRLSLCAIQPSSCHIEHQKNSQLSVPLDSKPWFIKEAAILSEFKAFIHHISEPGILEKNQLKVLCLRECSHFH